MARQRTTSVVGGERVGLDVAMLRCRTYGHAWEEFYPDDMDSPAYGWRLSLRCIRCTAQRHDVIDTIGRVSQRQYVYPDGYQMQRDEVPTREQLRQSMFERVRAKLDAAHALGVLTVVAS